MARPSHRGKILEEGLRLVHERGFGAASVRDIVRAAGVPQGSFTNHFPSKEAFGLEVLELYFADSRQTIAETLLNDDLPPLERLGLYIDRAIDCMKADGARSGCLIGNFTAEVVDQSEATRLRLVEIFAEIEAAVTYCLKAAAAAGELSPDKDVDALSGLIVSGLQGATLIAKAQRSAEPVERFKALLCGAILR